MARTGIIDITDLSGGISDSHPSLLAANEVIEADQVDFWEGNGVCRRLGTTQIDSGKAPYWSVDAHIPAQPPSASTNFLFMNNSGTIRSYDYAYTPATITPSPADTPTTPWSAVTLHGKFFVSYLDNASSNRLHVYDGTTWRRAGLAPATAAPTVANTGGGAYLAIIRYYRVRFTKESGGVVLVQSEPSPQVSFTPSGSGAAARVTRPTAPGESETHWRVEASPDGANFYFIGASVAIGTTTFDDSTDPSNYATVGILSADIGDYTVIPAYRWLAVDNDRLILGAQWLNSSTSTDARVSWTQLVAETGSGNDERLPTDVANYIDLDQNAGGALTGLIGYDNKVVAFKSRFIFTLVRSGLNANAYVLGEVVREQGAVPFSVVSGEDVQGRPCVYFLDPYNGPSIHGAEGTRPLATKRLLRTWRDYRKIAIDSTGEIQAAGLYYPIKKQVFWDVDYSGGTVSPSYHSVRWVLDIESGGVTFNTTGPFANSNTVTNFSNPSGKAMAMWHDAPHVGTHEGNGSASRLLRLDDPTITTDMGTGYRSYIKTRAYPLNRFIDQGAVIKAVVEGYNVTSSVTLTLSLLRDYSLEQLDYTFDLPTTGTFITTIDNVHLAETRVAQFIIGNPSGFVSAQGPWQIHRITFEVVSGGEG